MLRDDAKVRRRLLVTIVALLVGQFIGVTNSTIVVTALPTILGELGGTASDATWIMSSSLLGITVTTPIWGRLSDRVSPIWLLRISLFGFIASSVAGGLATSTGHIIAARAFQGLSFGGLVSLTMIVLANIVPPRERGKYMGWMSAVNLVGMLGAPLLGGIVVESPLGWRGCFFVAIPIAVLVLVLLQFSVRIERYSKDRARIDYPGAVLLAIGVTLVLVWVSFVGSAFELLSLPTLVLLGAGLLYLVGALAVEWYAEVPILPLRLLGGRVLALSSVATVCFGMAGIGLAVLMSLYLQTGRGVAPTVAGLIIVLSAVGSAVSSFLIGGLSARTGRLRRFILPSAIVLSCGLVLLATMGPEAPLYYVGAFLLLLGLGQGGTNHFIVLAVQNAVRLGDIGSVSGFMSFLQLLGGSIALALTSFLLSNQLADLQAGGLDEAAAYAEAVPHVFLVLFVIAAVGTAAVALLPRIRLRRTLDLEEEPADS